MRKEDWFERLNAYIDTVRDKPFAWGSHDCCLFSAACVEAMTGTDYMADYRGKYSDKDGAQSVLKGKTLYMTLKGILGKPVPMSQAHRGDVVYYVSEDGPCVGICIGQDALFVGQQEQEGLVTVPMSECAKAFHIPF